MSIKRRLPTILKPVWNNVNYAVPMMRNAAPSFPAAAGMPAKKETDIAALDFGVRLFQNSIRKQGKGNVLISPLSILTAFVMAANGARGNTLAQMENAFGASVSELNKYLGRYKATQAAGRELLIANAVWLRKNLEIALEPEFLQAGEKYLNASVHLAPFDTATLEQINSWVTKHTNGKITEILNDLNPCATMYLLNAVSFSAEWVESFMVTQVEERDFTKEDGTIQRVEMMCTEEDYYLRDSCAGGFLKYYKGGRYAFAALLPKRGIMVAQYAASLTGERLHSILANPIHNEVDIELPKFQVEYGIELSSISQEMGIIDAFQRQADFSGIGRLKREKLSLEGALHRTYISVHENGTDASAMLLGALASDKKYVHLNRPFVYMIVDCKVNFPVFIGTVTEIV